jgi:hypothetical protein
MAKFATLSGGISLTTNFSQVIKAGGVQTDKKLVCYRIREFDQKKFLPKEARLF